MNYSKISKILSLTTILFAFVLLVKAQEIPVPAEVNEDFSEEDYAKFVKINKELIPIQQQAEGEMVKAIADNDLDVERFQELAQAQQSGNITAVSDDPEEIAKFNEAGQKVLDVQQKAQDDIKKKIGENQMDLEKFQNISMAYNQSEKVRNKIDELFKAEEEGQDHPE